MVVVRCSLNGKGPLSRQEWHVRVRASPSIGNDVCVHQTWKVMAVCARPFEGDDVSWKREIIRWRRGKLSCGRALSTVDREIMHRAPWGGNVTAPHIREVLLR